MKFKSGTSSSTIRVSLTIALVTTLLSVLPTAAHADRLPNGTYNCLTGRASAVTPTFTMTSNVVSSGGSCTGAVVIPEGVTSIGGNAFLQSTITSIIIPSSVRTILGGAFLEAASLNSVTMSSGLLSMGFGVFLGATALTSIDIPSTVTSIGTNVFFNTPLLLNYTYCGNIDLIDLVDTKLDGKSGTCTVPGAPTIGTATSTGTTTATVAFSAPRSNGGLTILSYTATSSPGSITATLTQASSGTISVTGLTAGTAYTFTVKANNTNGNSSASAASNSITTTAPTTVPGAPTIGTATSTGTTTATVAFSAPESNGGSTILSYTATSSPGSITATLIQASSGTISVTGLTAGTAYTFTVKANNAEGNSSASAASNSVTTSLPAPVVVYIPPTPVPFLKNLTSPILFVVNGNKGKLFCMAGMYQFGYTLDGVIQGVPAPYIKPTSYIFKLLLNGVAQSLLTLTTSDSAPFWDATGLPSGSIASCSVTVTVNTLTNTATSTDLSDENKSKLSAASSLLNQAIRYENNVVLLMNLINSNIYEDALVSNRATWRTAVETNRFSYDAELVRINSLTALTSPNWPAYIRKLKATARNNYIATLRKNSADYRASAPLALAIKTAANKATLDAKSAAIAKANANYGAAIESIGYGVLIP